MDLSFLGFLFLYHFVYNYLYCLSCHFFYFFPLPYQYVLIKCFVHKCPLDGYWTNKWGDSFSVLFLIKFRIFAGRISALYRPRHVESSTSPSRRSWIIMICSASCIINLYSENKQLRETYGNKCVYLGKIMRVTNFNHGS